MRFLRLDVQAGATLTLDYGKDKVVINDCAVDQFLLLCINTCTLNGCYRQLDTTNEVTKTAPNDIMLSFPFRKEKHSAVFEDIKNNFN